MKSNSKGEFEMFATFDYNGHYFRTAEEAIRDFDERNGNV